MKSLFILLFLGLPTLTFARSGDEVRNGGGLAENYLIFALKNLGRSIDFCLTRPSCAQKAEDRDLLLKIKTTLPEEISKNVLKFSSEAKDPGLFIIDGVVRLAVTGSHVGDPIYYNLDLLYRKGEVFMNYGQAIQTLIHELGHHHGSVNHDQLEILGAAVRSVNEGNVSDVAYLPHLNTLGFSAIATEAKSYSAGGLLSLVFKKEMVDLTSEFSSLLVECDPDTTGLRPLKSSAVQFFNLHWIQAKETFLTGEKTLEGNAVLYCSHGPSREYRKFYSFKVGVKANFSAYFLYQGHRLLEKPRFLFKMDGAVQLPDFKDIK